MRLKYYSGAQVLEILETVEDPHSYFDLLQKFDDTPTADVRENVHATWQRDIIEDAKSDRRIYEGKWVCSNCGYGEDVPTVMGEPTVWNYCPNCGAEMEGSDG